MKFYLYSNYDPTSKGFYLLETEEEFTFEKIKYITMGIVKIRMDIILIIQRKWRKIWKLK